MIKTTPLGPIVRFDLARTILGRGRYWTTAYLVDGVLIDTGCAHTAGELAEVLNDVSIGCIVNTHSHEDHIGANGLLQRSSGRLEICAHPLALPTLADPRNLRPFHAYRRLFWGWPEPSLGRPVENGERIQSEHHSLEVIYSPGHSSDHICLYERERGWMFTGDLFVGGRDRALRAETSFWQLVASLRQIAAYPITLLLPGSARVRQHPEKDLQAKLAYLEEIGGKVLDLHRRGWSVRAIAKRLFGGVMLVELFTLGHFSRRQLVLSILRGSPE